MRNDPTCLPPQVSGLKSQPSKGSASDPILPPTSGLRPQVSALQRLRPSEIYKYTERPFFDSQDRVSQPFIKTRKLDWCPISHHLLEPFIDIYLKSHDS